MSALETVSPVRGTAYSVTTEGVDHRDRLGFWRDAVCKKVVELDFKTQADEFNANLHGARLADLVVSRIVATAHDAVHARSSFAPADDRLVFNFVLAGRMLVRQDGKEVLLNAGDGAVCAADRQYLLHFAQPFQVACITVDKDQVVSRAANLRRCTASSLAKASDLSGIVYDYVAGLAQRMATLSPSSSEKISRNFTELLRAMLSDVLQNSPLPLSEYRLTALIRVKDFVERNLSDSSLSADAVGSALKLSSRYINQLLEAEGTSLLRYIWRRRVERAAADLRNPALQGSTISTIAMASGFNDFSHFSKAFRQRFGVSPRDYRAGERQAPPTQSL